MLNSCPKWRNKVKVASFKTLRFAQMFDQLLGRFRVCLGNLTLNEVGKGASCVDAVDGCNANSRTVLARLILVVGQDTMTEDVFADESRASLLNLLHSLGS